MKYFDERYRNYNQSERCIIEEGGGAVMLAAGCGGGGTQREIDIRASAQCHWQWPAAAASSQQMPQVPTPLLPEHPTSHAPPTIPWPPTHKMPQNPTLSASAPAFPRQISEPLIAAIDAYFMKCASNQLVHHTSLHHTTTASNQLTLPDGGSIDLLRWASPPAVIDARLLSQGKDEGGDYKMVGGRSAPKAGTSQQSAAKEKRRPDPGGGAIGAAKPPPQMDSRAAANARVDKIFDRECAEDLDRIMKEITNQPRTPPMQTTEKTAVAPAPPLNAGVVSTLPPWHQHCNAGSTDTEKTAVAPAQPLNAGVVPTLLPWRQHCRADNTVAVNTVAKGPTQAMNLNSLPRTPVSRPGNTAGGRGLNTGGGRASPAGVGRGRGSPQGGGQAPPPGGGGNGGGGDTPVGWTSLNLQLKPEDYTAPADGPHTVENCRGAFLATLNRLFQSITTRQDDSATRYEFKWRTPAPAVPSPGSITAPRTASAVGEVEENKLFLAMILSHIVFKGHPGCVENQMLSDLFDYEPDFSGTSITYSAELVLSGVSKGN